MAEVEAIIKVCDSCAAQIPQLKPPTDEAETLYNSLRISIPSEEEGKEDTFEDNDIVTIFVPYKHHAVSQETDPACTYEYIDAHKINLCKDCYNKIKDEYENMVESFVELFNQFSEPEKNFDNESE